ncbi:MAG TPA: hypothetical protein VFU15_00230 [Bacteroidia bacterium]|nr:hypothetical protein [Bacteroidia bacterium]
MQQDTWDNKAGNPGIKAYDFGPRAGLFYHFNGKFTAETNFYYGVTNIVKDQELAQYATWKVQQWTMGVRYNILKPAGSSGTSAQ